MGRYRAGTSSVTAKIRLRIAGWWMLTLHRLSAKAEANYVVAYRVRHGAPCLAEYLQAGQGSIVPTGKDN